MDRIVIDNNEHAVCASCGGSCCKWMPGMAAPDDFLTAESELDVGRIREMVVDGRWCFDCWDGDPRLDADEVSDVPFLRPVVVGSEGEVFERSYGGRCILHGDSGCELAFAQRPLECRGLLPDVDRPGECCRGVDGISKREIAIMWLPYREQVWQLIYEIRANKRQ